MKKKCFMVVPLVAVFCIAAGLFFANKIDKEYTSMAERVGKEYNYTVVAMASELQFTYTSMVNAADTIVIAQVADQLTEDNSVITQKYREKNKSTYVSDFYSVRQVEPLKTVKGNADNLLIQQECAKLTTDKVVTYDACYPMIKGDVYALFTVKQEETNNINVPFSTDNGILNLSYLKLNRRADLAAMTAVDLFETGFPKELETAFLKSRHPGNLVDEDILIPIFEDNAYRWNSVVVTTPYTENGMELSVEYTMVDGVYYFRTNGYPGYYDGTW